MLGRAVRNGDKRKVYVCGTHAGKLYFRLFRRLFKALHCHFVLGKVYARIPFEGFHKVVYYLVIKVVAAKVGIAVGCKHLEHAVADFQNGNVEGTAAKVVNHYLLAALLLVKPVGKRRRSRLVDNTQHVKSRNFARVLGCLTLTVVEVCGAGDNRVRNLCAEVAFRVRL